MWYFLIFSVSMIFVSLASSKNLLNYRYNYFTYVFSAAAIGSLSILNWVRDYSIGTDLGVYGNSIFNLTKEYDSFSLFYRDAEEYGLSETGYALWNYSISFITNNNHIYYLITGLFVNALFFASCYLMRDLVPLPLSWFTYLMLIYPMTLNLLRQGMALSLVLLAGVLAIRERYLFSLLLVGIAYSLHNSAMITLIIILFIYLLNKSSINNKNIIIISFIILSFLLSPIINFLFESGLLSDKYAQYMSGTNEAGLLNSTLLRLPFLILAIICLIVYRDKSTTQEKALWAIIVAECGFLPVQAISASAFRIALYYSVFKILAYPAMIKYLKIPRSIAILLYCIAIVGIFVLQIVIMRSNQIYPFVVAKDLWL